MAQTYQTPVIWSIRFRHDARTAILTDTTFSALCGRCIRGAHNIMRIDKDPDAPLFAPIGDEAFSLDLSEVLAGYEAVLVAIQDRNIKQAVVEFSTRRGLPVADLENSEILPRAVLKNANFATVASLAVPWSVDFPGYVTWREANCAA